jgi:hypothetical protein
VGIIHNPIKNTLISYFKSKSVSESFKIKVFYTENFAFVWEELVRHALKEDKSFRNKLEPKFKRKETRLKWFPTTQELDDYLSNNKSITQIRREVSGTGFRLTFEIKSESIPDLFSVYNGKKIIGDAKYYNDPEGSEYEKEFRTYNILSENKYPMLILTPGLRNKSLQVRREGELELIILQLSIEQVIEDALTKGDSCIHWIHVLLFDKKYTSEKRAQQP